MCGPNTVEEQKKLFQTIQTTTQDEKQGLSPTPFAPSQAAASLEKTKRAQLRSTLTEEEKARLNAFTPPPPDFVPLKEHEVASLGKWKKKSYLAKKAAYDERVKQWEKQTNFKKETVQMSIDAQRLGDTWPTLEATPDAMDLALKRNALDQTELNEISNLEYKVWLREGGVEAREALINLERYMQETFVANDMNSTLRQGGPPQSFLGSAAIQAKNALTKKKMTRDIVSRRGVGSDALAGMMGIGGTPEQAKALLQQKLSAGEEVILTEKGFCSTSIRANAGYASSGIEFIILTRKGTSAIDFSNHGSRDTEKELLINAGTKFRVVKAFFNDGTPGSQRDVLMEQSKGKNSWKIYLETIPQGDDAGVEQ